MNGYDVFVVGSANIDQTVLVGRMPEEGETVHGLDYKICCGGKGANQAVASARAEYGNSLSATTCPMQCPVYVPTASHPNASICSAQRGGQYSITTK